MTTATADRVASLARHAEEMWAAGRIDLARRSAYEALGLDPTCADAHETLAFVCGRERDWAASRREALAALAVAPHRCRSMVALAFASLHLGLHDESRDAIARALAACPDDPGILANGARIARLQLRAGESRAYAERGAALDPMHPDVVFELACSRIQDGRRSEAEALARAALQRNPEDRQAATIIASLAADRGEIAAAYEVAGDLLAAAPNDRLAHGLIDGIRAERRRRVHERSGIALVAGTMTLVTIIGSPGFRPTLVAGVVVVGVIAAMIGVGVWAVARDRALNREEWK